MHKKLLFAIINRRLTFCDACAQLGISEEDVYVKSNGEKEEDEVGEIKGDSLKLQTDKKKDTAIDDEGDGEVFVKGESDSSNDEKKPAD